MRISHRIAAAGCILGCWLLFPARSAVQDAGAPIRLWSGEAPGERGAVPEDKVEEQNPNASPRSRRVTAVGAPTLTPFVLPRDRGTGAAVIIAPGGAYRFLSWDSEGEEVARKFNEFGVSAFVLKYRVPRRDFDSANSLPLMDAQRAIRLVRSRAGEWGLRPDRIGFIGFSAGGHLGANLSTNHARPVEGKTDALDQGDARPSFSILIYPGGYVDRSDPNKIADGYPIDANTPPTFVSVAADDKGSVDASVLWWRTLKNAGVKTELHVFASGGHGFGLRPRAGNAATWPARAADWLRELGFLRKD